MFITVLCTCVFQCFVHVYFSALYMCISVLHFHKIPLYGTFILTFGSAIITAVIVKFVVVPWQRKKIQSKFSNDVLDIVRKPELKVGL